MAYDRKAQNAVVPAIAFSSGGTYCGMAQKEAPRVGQQLKVLWGQIMAYSTLITIPVLVFFLAFQRRFVSSIASAGVKG
jgi:ABC-type glycerol-3-phosphate transport system permease component